MNFFRLVVAFSAFVLGVSLAQARDLPATSEVINGTVDQVYVAEVQAASTALVNTVKEACLVNVNHRYERVAFTATCQRISDKQTRVTLHIDLNTVLDSSESERNVVLFMFWAGLHRAMADMHR